MAQRLKIKVNGRVHNVVATPNTPLLYVLRNELRLNGPRFGCGLAQCGSCSVLHNGKEIRACITPVAAVAKGGVTTLEGLHALWQAGERGPSKGEARLHPVQQAWIDEQVPQCGYCQNGMMIKATELLQKVPRPTEAQIRSHMNTHLCRCGTYPRILRAVKRASTTMAKEA
jgi:aerobic-type carbon monoxide dehydrogenase small subunit (CoxS/CutS family)